MLPIRLVTFDALHTIITLAFPSTPSIRRSSRLISASFLQTLSNTLSNLESRSKEHPSYNKGAENWWSDVIQRTALGAGGDEQAIDDHLPDIVNQLMTRFSSREGYKAFNDAIPTIRRLDQQLAIRTAVISNGDGRIRSVLKDLGFPDTLWPIVLSEEEGIEKPSPGIFMKALEFVNQEEALKHDPIRPQECLHIGDELVCDYTGATRSRLNALLLRREGPEGEHEHKEADERLGGVEVIQGLDEVISWVQGNK
ncbi:HAD-like domain-containing protein [Pholiota molesta]|nr:HAD-like domain-containing protein [Pholiota molesta]